jgi:RNA polymerase sigma factor (sigma-70 family)
VVVAINADRKRWKRETSAPMAPRDDGESVEDHAGAITTSVVLRAALARLTKRQRAAIVLRFFADFPVADIAQALGCAEGTVRATLHQALGIMRIDVGGGVDE